MARVITLGTIQDAGIPHLGCTCKNCLEIGSKEYYVASIAIITDNKSILIDATPNLVQQTILLKKHNKRNKIGFDELFISHLHIGHYLGLIYFGKESYPTNNLSIYASKENIEFLSNNKPFSYLNDRNQVKFISLISEKAVKIDDKTSIIPFEVPHRNEDGNTFGFIIKSEKSLIYIPDMDYLSEDVIKKIEEVDFAIIDGTFFSKNEIMRQKEVPHPPINEQMKQLHEVKKSTKIFFTHFNHNNPVLDKNSMEYKSVIESGFFIAKENLILDI